MWKRLIKILDLTVLSEVGMYDQTKRLTNHRKLKGSLYSQIKWDNL